MYLTDTRIATNEQVNTPKQIIDNLSPKLKAYLESLDKASNQQQTTNNKELTTNNANCDC
jgi:hypothetical protein